MTDLEIEKLADALVRRLNTKIEEDQKEELSDAMLEVVHRMARQTFERLAVLFRDIEDSL